MDSIFEQPRSIPKRTPVTQNFQAVVPEASLIFQNDPRDSRSQKPTIPPHQQSYNAWKLQNSKQDDSIVKKMEDVENNQNYPNFNYMKGPCDVSNNRSMLKKVRFEPPIQSASIVRSPNFQALLRGKNEKSGKIDTGQYTAPLKAYKVNANIDDSLLNMIPKHSPKKNPIQRPKTSGESSETFATLPTQNQRQEFGHKTSSEQYRQHVDQFRQNGDQFKQNGDQFRPNGDQFNQNGDQLRQGGQFRPNVDNFNQRDEPRQERSYRNPEGPSDLFEKSTLNAESLKKFTLPPHILEQKALEQKAFEQRALEQEKAILNQPLPPKTPEVVPEPSNQTESSKESCKCNCKGDAKEAPVQASPSVTELLNIVKIQNEQLQLLQNQVEQLIKLNEKSRKDDIEKAINALVKCPPKSKKSTDLIPKPKNVVLYKDEKVGTSYNEGISKKLTQENVVSRDKDKISVGIMTSFQVKYTPPFNKKTHRLKKRVERASSSDDYDTESSSNKNQNQVFTETWHDRRGMRYNNNFDERDDTLDMGLEESLKVQEPPLSPNHTVHVDMQDYSSDSDDESSSEDPGWTFYDNILGQVNNILENSPTPNRGRSCRGNRYPKSTDRTMELIKQTTLKNLKEQGLVGSSGEFANMKPNEISFAVQQILMKYMSDEELANFAQNNGNVEHTEERHDYNPRGHQRGHNHGRYQKPRSRASNPGSPKILDITTLKKQPKLL